MAKNPFALPGMKKLPKEYTDKNINAPMPLRISSSLPSDRLTSPTSLASPKSPAIPGQPEISERAKRFRRLAGILGPKK